MWRHTSRIQIRNLTLVSCLFYVYKFIFVNHPYILSAYLFSIFCVYIFLYILNTVWSCFRFKEQLYHQWSAREVPAEQTLHRTARKTARSAQWRHKTQGRAARGRRGFGTQRDGSERKRALMTRLWRVDYDVFPQSVKETWNIWQTTNGDWCMFIALRTQCMHWHSDLCIFIHTWLIDLDLH